MPIFAAVDLKGDLRLHMVPEAALWVLEAYPHPEGSVPAEFVAETRDLDSDDAFETLRRVRYWPLLKESVQRMRDADGFSYARAVGFQIVLAAFPALIFFVGVSVWTGNESLQASVDTILTSVTPGSTSDFLQQAVEQGEENARSQTWAVILGGLAALTSGAVGMSQVQKAANRLYGLEGDRDWLPRYGLAVVLSLTAGVLLGAAFVAMAFGGGIAEGLDAESIWVWLRWPLGAVGVVIALALLYSQAPNRRQPDVSWLMVGGITATVLWLAFSAGLAAYLGLSSTFGEAYGPLAGLIGLLIWAQLTGVAVLGGAAFAAQLEAERVEAAGLEESPRTAENRTG